MKTIHVKNIEKYQPGYKDRNLIWCKMYFSMINGDPEFEMLCEIDKMRLISFIMLEMQIKKPVPLDEEYLKRKGFDLEERPISLTLQMLHTFVDVCNATEKSPYPRVDKSRVDKSRVDKSRVDKSKKRFTPPTLSEIKDYISKNNYSVNPDTFYKFFTTGDWIDSKGNKVRNWKQKIITWGSRDNGSKSTFEPKATPGKYEGIGVDSEEYFKDG